MVKNEVWLLKITTCYTAYLPQGGKCGDKIEWEYLDQKGLASYFIQILPYFSNLGVCVCKFVKSFILSGAVHIKLAITSHSTDSSMKNEIPYPVNRKCYILVVCVLNRLNARVKHL